jgi:hypothetical protein
MGTLDASAGMDVLRVLSQAGPADAVSPDAAAAVVRVQLAPRQAACCAHATLERDGNGSARPAFGFNSARLDQVGSGTPLASLMPRARILRYAFRSADLCAQNRICGARRGGTKRDHDEANGCRSVSARHARANAQPGARSRPGAPSMVRLERGCRGNVSRPGHASDVAGHHGRCDQCRQPSHLRSDERRSGQVLGGQRLR